MDAPPEPDEVPVRSYSWLPLALCISLVVPSAAAAAPTLTEYGTAAGITSSAGPTGITGGPGGLWFTELTNPGALAQLVVPGFTATEWDYYNSAIVGGREPAGVTLGPDGNLWFAQQKGTGTIVRFDPATQIATTFPTTTNASGVNDVAAGSDGAIWFTENLKNRIGRITVDGTMTEYAIPTAASEPRGIRPGPDGALWFAESAAGVRKLGRIDPDTKVITEFPLPSGSHVPWDVVAGPDGAVWFSEVGAGGAIGRMTTGGTVTDEFPVGGDLYLPMNLTAGSDGNIWFTRPAPPGSIGRVTAGGTVTLYPVPTVTSMPLDITPGPDGNLWFTETAGTGGVGRITLGPGVETSAPTGPDASSVVLHGKVSPNAQTTSYWFEYGLSKSYGAQTSAMSAGTGSAPVLVQASLNGLASSLTFHARLVAQNGTDTTFGADRTFTTAAAPGSGGSVPPASLPAATPLATDLDGGLPEPAAPAADAPHARIGHTMIAAAMKGSVTILRPGAGDFEPLKDDAEIPVGSVVDATDGVVLLRSAINRRGTTQTGRFWGGAFSIRQAASLHGMTELRLRGTPTGCGSGGHAAAKKSTPQLWGHDNHGRFRTRGSNSVATVRGTSWFTQERCGGTLTRVSSGSVEVRDRVLHRVVRVRAGHSYLAHNPH